MAQQKTLMSKSQGILVCCIVVALFSGKWLIGQRGSETMEELGFSIEVDNEYGKLSIVNNSLHRMKNVTGTIREDYSYVDNGFITHSFVIDELGPGGQYSIPLVYVKDDEDIGRIDVWLACNRRKAHYQGQWSYAMDAYIFESLYNALKSKVKSKLLDIDTGGVLLGKDNPESMAKGIN